LEADHQLIVSLSSFSANGVRYLRAYRQFDGLGVVAFKKFLKWLVSGGVSVSYMMSSWHPFSTLPSVKDVKQQVYHKPPQEFQQVFITAFNHKP